MTWSRAAVCWLAAALLALVYLGTAPAPAPQPMAQQAAAAPPNASPAERAYQLDAATLRRVEVRRGDTTVVLERTDAGWAATAPGGRTIPPGLVQAFVQQLVDSGDGERIADDPQSTAYGFAEPQMRIAASDGGGVRLGLVVGARTPAGTAAYALVEEDGRVVLVGLNLLYYGDLLLG